MKWLMQIHRIKEVKGYGVGQMQQIQLLYSPLKGLKWYWYGQRIEIVHRKGNLTPLHVAPNMC